MLVLAVGGSSPQLGEPKSLSLRGAGRDPVGGSLRLGQLSGVEANGDDSDTGIWIRTQRLASNSPPPRGGHPLIAPGPVGLRPQTHRNLRTQQRGRRGIRRGRDRQLLGQAQAQALWCQWAPKAPWTCRPPQRTGAPFSSGHLKLSRCHHHLSGTGTAPVVCHRN